MQKKFLPVHPQWYLKTNAGKLLYSKPALNLYEHNGSLAKLSLKVKCILNFHKSELSSVWGICVQLNRCVMSCTYVLQNCSMPKWFWPYIYKDQFNGKYYIIPNQISFVAVILHKLSLIMMSRNNNSSVCLYISTLACVNT